MEVVVLKIQFELNNVAKECFFSLVGSFLLARWLVIIARLQLFFLAGGCA